MFDCHDTRSLFIPSPFPLLLSLVLSIHEWVFACEWERTKCKYAVYFSVFFLFFPFLLPFFSTR